MGEELKAELAGLKVLAYLQHLDHLIESLHKMDGGAYEGDFVIYSEEREFLSYMVEDIRETLSVIPEFERCNKIRECVRRTQNA